MVWLQRHGRRTVAVLCGLTGVGIVAFWVNWFATGQHRSAQPECYRIFENTFPLPDGVMAGLLLMAAYALWHRGRRAPVWGLLGAGMLLHLSALDAYYHAQHGNFSDWSDPETWSRVFISVHALALALVLMAGFLWRTRRDALQQRDLAAAVVMLVIAGLTVMYWSTQLGGDAATDTDCESQFLSAFLLADTCLAVLFGLSAVGLLMRRAWAPRLGLVCCGLLWFGTLIFAAFAALNEPLIAGREAGYWGLIALSFIVTLWLTWRMCRGIGQCPAVTNANSP